jgi:hypothetical protein
VAAVRGPRLDKGRGSRAALARREGRAVFDHPYPVETFAMLVSLHQRNVFSPAASLCDPTISVVQHSLAGRTLMIVTCPECRIEIANHTLACPKCGNRWSSHYGWQKKPLSEPLPPSSFGSRLSPLDQEDDDGPRPVRVRPDDRATRNLANLGRRRSSPASRDRGRC